MSHMLRTATFRAISAVFLGLLLVGMANGKDPQPASKSDGLTGKQAEQLIKDLDSDAFRTRERAAKKLEKAGVRAFDALVKHAGRGSLETRMRCFEILGKALQSDDKRVAAEAKKSLQKLAKSDNRGVANRAKSVLTEPKQQKLDPDHRRRQWSD